MNRATKEKTFRAMMQAGEDGARINMQSDGELATVFIIMTGEGKLQMVQWARPEHPREALDAVKEIVKELNAQALVVIAETHLGVAQGKHSTGADMVNVADGVLVYGYLPGDRNNPDYASARTFLTNENRGLLSVRMEIRPHVTDWVREAFA